MQISNKNYLVAGICGLLIAGGSLLAYQQGYFSESSGTAPLFSIQSVRDIQKALQERNQGNSRQDQGTETKNSGTESQLCGNGIKETGEECDDGNQNNNDACNNYCKYNIPTTTTTFYCGDGIVQTPEQCDDGNAVNNDTCINTCLLNNTIFSSCQNQNYIPQIECEALVALYNTTEGTQRTNHNAWLVDGNPCTWYGITCGTMVGGNNNNLHVLKLSLTSNNLVGSIPTEIGNLAELTELYLDKNKLCGTLPETVLQLKKIGKTESTVPGSCVNKFTTIATKNIRFDGDNLIKYGYSPDMMKWIECNFYGYYLNSNTNIPNCKYTISDITDPMPPAPTTQAEQDAWKWEDACGNPNLLQDGRYGQQSQLCGTNNPAVCGNGIKEGSEQCDDGNQDNNDACNNYCLKNDLDNPCSSDSECNDNTVCTSDVCQDKVCHHYPVCAAGQTCTANPGGRPECN